MLSLLVCFAVVAWEGQRINWLTPHPGNGPSALILSYILHGNVPYYVGGHQDQTLDQKLRQTPNLLHVKTDTYRHLQSSLRYSSQALPVNVLLDTLLRPYGDTDIGSESCIEWHHEPSSAVSHIVLGNAPRAGGQWADNPISASWDIGALSYAEQLSLPGYSLADHWRVTRKAALPEMLRPTRTDISEYFAAYPAAVGISDATRTSTQVDDVVRTSRGFYVRSHHLHCKNIVLASGVFSTNLMPPSFLTPLNTLSSTTGPVLVIGSGFTAADIIISTPPDRKIIHLFNWDPDNRPSPLRGCHALAYPEYAGVYRQMKLAAMRSSNTRRANEVQQKKSRRTSDISNLPFFDQRDWQATYEGIPNARILSVSINPSAAESHGLIDGGGGSYNRQRSSQFHGSSNGHRDGEASRLQLQGSIAANTATVEIHRSTFGDTVGRCVSSFHYAAGRRGSLAYLAGPLLREVLPVAFGSPDQMLSRANGDSHDTSHEISQLPGRISGQTLRDKIEDFHHHGHADNPMEVAPSVFAIGSLTGDTLIRFAYGACTSVAATIMDRANEKITNDG